MRRELQFRCIRTCMILRLRAKLVAFLSWLTISALGQLIDGPPILRPVFGGYRHARYA